MAYGNWGSFVYKNGIRQPNREDNTPYSEDEIEAGYWQAFGWLDENGKRTTTGKELFCCHATLGSGKIRLCGYKSSPILYWDLKEINLKPYQKGINAGTDNWYWYESDGIEGELYGYKFKAKPDTDPKSVDLELIEPDGTKWTGKSGYCMGSGWKE
jgi:hypothetical protein